MGDGLPVTIHDLIQEPDGWPAFYSLPAAVYAGDPFYLPSPAESVRAEICRSEEPQRILLVLRDGEPVARVCARVADQLDPDGPIGLLGYFEALDDLEAVSAMIDTAIRWLREQGVSRVIGPMNGDTWHKYRLNAGPFDSPPFLMEPYNASYYADLWQQCGFRVLAEYYSKHVPDVEAILPRMKQYYDRTLERGISYRSFNMERYDEELEVLYELSCEIFSANPFYRRISLREFKALYTDARAILRRNLVWFCQDSDGEYAGFVFSFPDYFAAIRKMGGKRNLWAKVKFVLNRSKADTLNVKTLGAIPKHRGTGLGSALIYKAYREGVNQGYKKANMCLIHRDNISGRLDGGMGRLIRTYLLYELIIEDGE
jgi:GNAT superfamily N-acetyltransferase